MEDLTYNKWVKSFFEGNFFTKGWNDRIQEILASVSEQNQEIENELNILGSLISKEWAKENNIRKINNSDLLQWGNEMKQAAQVSSSELLVKLNQIGQEIQKKI